MAFDDLAKRMAASRGKQIDDGPVDPAKLLAEQARRNTRDSGIGLLAGGLLLTAVAVGITLFSYYTAPGHYYVAATGLAAFGVLGVIAGISTLREARRSS